MKNNFCLYILCASLGYVWGWGPDLSVWSSQAEGESIQASTEITARNKYENLPCPTEAEFQDLAHYVKLEIPAGESLDKDCRFDNQRAVFGKVLLLMDSLKFDFPKNWPTVLKENLGNSLKFLHDRSAKLTLDLAQKDSLAYNKVDIKEIFLGGRFFTIDPLVGVAILIHEARHSEPQASTHTHCEAGDIPRTGGACDEVFSMEDNKAGAYAYGTLFNIALALYGRDLAPSDRESAMADALVELAARFNILPSVFAVKHDILVTLQEDGTLAWIDPIKKRATPVALRLQEGEKPVRIEFYPKNNGLIIYTNLNGLYGWHPVTGQSTIFPDLIKAQDGVKDMARLRIPFGEMTLYAARDAKNNLTFVEYSPSVNKSVRKQYPFHRSDDQLPTSPFHRMFLALFDESVYLTQDGKLYLARHYGNQKSFMEREELQSPQGWIAGTGGVLYDTLYLIDARGDLKQVSMELNPDDEGSGYDKIVKVQDSKLQGPGPLSKFAQGLDVQMGLDRDGALHVWGYNSVQSKPLNLSYPVTDFVLMQVIDVKDSIGKIPSEFQQIWKSEAAMKRPYQN